jgi:hypothetical protein
MESKSYEIRGKTLTQGEMTLGQTKKLLELTAEIAEGAEDVTKIKDVKSAINWLLKRGLIDRVLEIVLIGDKDGIVWDDLSNSQLEAIVSDFLTLNGGWIAKLSGSLKKLKS